MIVASVTEVFSIGSVLPFLGVLTDPEKLFANESLQPLILLMGIESHQDLLLPFTLLFVMLAIVAGLARIALIWGQTHLSMAIGADFGIQVYERTLYQPYHMHISRNSSEILAGVQKANELMGTIIQPVLVLISSGIILIAVITTLLAVHASIALGVFLGFGLIYTAVASINKTRIAKNSETIANQRVRVNYAVQEGLGGIRDVLIHGTQPVYSALYKNALLPMQAALASNQVVSNSPRFGIEALGMVFIACLAYILAKSEGLMSSVPGAIPILGAIALGIQRILPVLQQIYTSYITIKGNLESTQDALDLLDQPMPSHDHWKQIDPLLFQTSIVLRNVSFRYNSEGPWVLKNVSLRIQKGSRVGIVGSTGSGKSTLLDLLMGLLEPSEGELIIDTTVIRPPNTRAWQAHLSHVPQAIFLADASIAQNIALGVPLDEIDLRRVWLAAEKAQLAQTIAMWPAGLDTVVGERGVRLSGGQRQRIGIARAFYKCTDVIVLDEATNALDNETESAVMESIASLSRDVTILVVTHRHDSLKQCDYIFKISKNLIESINPRRMFLQAPL